MHHTASCGGVPPDTNAAVGDTQVVEFVNDSFAVYNKTTGALVAGPTPDRMLFSTLGAPCSTTNGGDVLVKWDHANQRWLLAYNIGGNGPWPVCIAVSKTNDATGSYWTFHFSLTNGYDYPKWGIWPSGYFQSVDSRTTICAYNDVKLRAGDPTAEQICVAMGARDFHLLPGDVDSSAPPPSGQDEFFIGSMGRNGNTTLYFYSMHPDFVHGTATVVGTNLADSITVPQYTQLCPGGDCVPQLATSQLLASLGDASMYRFAYWNDGAIGIGSHQHWYVNHSVQASGGQGGVRWYEFRAPVQTVTISSVSLYQSGTYAPDSNYRWMGSIAHDKVGDIAVGYSESSSSIHPAIYVSGRVPTDPIGQLDSEVLLVQGNGSQVTNDRWGDYSSMALDASDGCTFWYTQEYYSATGTDWQTQMTSFKFNNCH